MTDLTKRIEAQREELAKLEAENERQRNLAYAKQLRDKASLLEKKVAVLRARAERYESGEDELPPLHRTAKPSDVVVAVPAAGGASGEGTPVG